MKHIHITTRAILVVVALPLLVALSACQGNTTSGTSTTPTQVSGVQTSGSQASGTPGSNVSPSSTGSASTALAAYKAVLLGQAEFFSTDQSATMSLTQLTQALGTGEDGQPLTMQQFAVVDLDGDGTPEVVLSESGYTGYEILHDQGGTVYGYNLGYRSFEQPKADGTFSFSGGANDNGFGTISFTTTAYNIKQVTYSQSSTDTAGNTTVAYFVNGNSSTQDAFQAAVTQQGAKADLSWIDLTPDNVNSQL